MSTIPGAEKYYPAVELDEQSVSTDLELHTIPEDFEVDPVTFEVLRHRLSQINKEQGQTLRNVSGSTVVTEANDFNVTISNERGDVTNFGPFVIHHAGTLDVMVKWILENRSEEPGIRPGDMFLCNDPWIGAIHQMDVAVIAPMFHDGEVFAWLSSTLHHLDLGGVNPGSLCPDARDVFAETQPTPPIKLVEGGDIRPDVEDIVLRQSRVGPYVSMDLRAQIAANNVAKERMREQIDKYGADTVKGVMEHTLDYAEERLRGRLTELPDGVWRHTDFIDVAHTGDRSIYRGDMELRKEGDELTVRITGDPNYGMINCTYAGLRGGVMLSVLPLLCYDIPWAIGGLYRAVDIEAEDGTIMNAEFPAGVSVASISASWLVENLGIQCISKMLGASEKYEDRLMAVSSGGWPIDGIMGVDHEGLPFVTLCMDVMSSGWGAKSTGDGVDSSGAFSIPAGQMPNVERMELRYPMLYLDRREEIDSGGAGKYRGGVGGSSHWIPHKTDVPITHILTAFGQGFPTSQGISGGYPGGTVRIEVTRDSNVWEVFEEGEIPVDRDDLEGDTEVLPPKYQTQQAENDAFFMRWTGGGGYGDPIHRDPQLVARDTENGYVSEREAERVYGVVFEVGEIDEAATEARREEIRNERLRTAPGGGEE